MHYAALIIISLLTTVSASYQNPLIYEYPFAGTKEDKRESSSYKFKWPIHKVAIIGAGGGGLVAYREFKRMGYQVRIFERDSVPGGNWHYTDEVPQNAPVPNLDPSEADFRPHIPPSDVLLPYEENFVGIEPGKMLNARREHRAPKPIWHSLTSTAPKQNQELRELPWPDHIPLTLTQNHLQRYVRTFASLHEINSNDNSPNTSYNTRVERVDKRFDADGRKVGWTLTLRKFIETGPTSYKIQWWTEDFDAIVVASGRFSAPNLPRIPGLSQWAQLYPELISHSRQYRRPEEFANQTVLVVGGSVSGTEIAEDISGKAKKVFLSVRPHEDSVFRETRNMYLSRVPNNVSIVPEIKFFHPLPIRPTDSSSGIQSGEIELINGTLLRGFDKVIFATGFRYAFPFLPQYHDASLRPNETIPSASGRPQPLVTDGTHIRSLHLDLFYIEEPTIGFINMNLGIESFMYSEFAASAIAKVWAGQAKLPSTKQMWELHWKRVRDAGGAYGGQFMYLGSAKEAAMVRYIVGWLNEDAVKYGGHQIDGPSENRHQVFLVWVVAQFPDYNVKSNQSAFSVSGGSFGLDVEEQRRLVETWTAGRDDW
ncbi:dimethylaniline monooxygenase [Lentinula edodes]|uniref:Dimethylaniline monooxygenase n=1 Tax=Lentinula edodes TaxID=5353 RepID=A0A1Q3E910_LENED|nr:dimethylaniline monooxygenase [Lentinula edodes]